MASELIRIQFAFSLATIESVQVLELQPAGKKKMTAEEFLRGYPIVDGMRFGPEVLS